MKLKRVTFTGADNSVCIMDMLAISNVHPWVEWGILLSQTRQGMPRFPGNRWLQALWEAKAMIASPDNFKLSAHLCGGWMRDIVMGQPSLFMKDPELWSIFDRVQINMHGIKMEPSDGFFSILREWKDKQWILQLDGVNDNLMHGFNPALKHNVVGLFDASGGAGVAPKAWPVLWRDYGGYAGGLGPHNLAAELERIAWAANGNEFWIDMESHVRSDGDRKFDLEKVKACIDIVAPYVA